MRFGMDLHMLPQELELVVDIERNCARHLSVVNDIMSWDKEYRSSQTGHFEGAALCSAVQVLAEETVLGYEAAKRVLWVVCREWEDVHRGLVSRTKGNTPQWSERLDNYILGLEYQMGGNELWSCTTGRYGHGTL
jgi:aristolochene synthase